MRRSHLPVSITVLYFVASACLGAAALLLFPIDDTPAALTPRDGVSFIVGESSEVRSYYINAGPSWGSDGPYEDGWYLEAGFTTRSTMGEDVYLAVRGELADQVAEACLPVESDLIGADLVELEEPPEIVRRSLGPEYSMENYWGAARPPWTFFVFKARYGEDRGITPWYCRFDEGGVEHTDEGFVVSYPSIELLWNSIPGIEENDGCIELSFPTVPPDAQLTFSDAARSVQRLEWFDFPYFGVCDQVNRGLSGTTERMRIDALAARVETYSGSKSVDRRTFLAGALLGLAAGLFVAGLQGLVERLTAHHAQAITGVTETASTTQAVSTAEPRVPDEADVDDDGGASQVDRGTTGTTQEGRATSDLGSDVQSENEVE